ncbi:MAG: hypothetical protein NUV77_09410 [Thermoguttaceae bacterium]|jgi:L-fucose isomerase-like protein|nr:hypothetical protein [Thermoguttaceae bacterium]
MNHELPVAFGSGCGSCGLSRRKFLAGCAACAAGVAGLSVPGMASAQGAAAAKPRVRLVFSHTPSTGPIWPNIGYDFEPPKKRFTEKIVQLCPDVEFLPVTVQNVDQARKLLEEDKAKNIDGYLVVLMACWGGVPQTIAAAGKPTIFADDLYGGSGEFLIAYSAVRRQGLKVGGISSSRIEDVADAARCFELLKQPGGSAEAFVAAVLASRKKNTKPAGDLVCLADPVQAVSPGECLKRLKQSKVLVIGANHGGLYKQIADVFGTTVVPFDFKELNECYQKADKEQAAQCADQWIRGAERVIEPSRDEIVKCAAMYLGMKEMLKRHGAQGITINCLGGFYGGHITAYPCLGFHQLNNDGLVGGCEADIISAMTMLTLTHLVGRPGYISDPVIDTSKNQIIYAHCVAPSKVFGPKGPTNPYHLRNHSEDRKGAAIRSLMPLGYMTTTVEFHPVRKEVIFHQGKSVENVDEDKACRTKLAVEVKGDIDKLMKEWDQWGWHRVTVYGDVKEPVFELAKALGMKVVEEA